jgi:hypothetical protein
MLMSRFALPRSRLLPRVALLLLAAVGGCPQRTAVWVEQGSTAQHVVFGVADKRGGTRAVAVGVLRVQQCGGPTTGSGAWWVVGPSAGTDSLRQIVYGQTPAGWVSEQGPRALTPGCYEVEVSGTGTTRFAVDSAGRVTEQGS